MLTHESPRCPFCLRPSSLDAYAPGWCSPRSRCSMTSAIYCRDGDSVAVAAFLRLLLATDEWTRGRTDAELADVRDTLADVEHDARLERLKGPPRHPGLTFGVAGDYLAASISHATTEATR